MWERTLQDLIRGLRANRSDESRFIAQAMSEIRREVKSGDMDLKAGAILKLTYLDMVGYDMSWASFNVVEVMSSPKYHLKAVGYLAASQSFNQDTDVLMLTTNMIKKDLGSSPLEVAAALNGLSDIATPDLARDLTPELIAMLNHSRAHIRKRAVLALYKVILKYPDALQVGLPRLRDRLDDPDPGVMSATVNVLCELTRRNPEEYLFLAPQLFQILTTSSNNWMLIKIIKLFGALAPAEPRLVKKLKPPISELISSTSAISLLYECVHTCIIGGMLDGPSELSLAETCTRKLAAFLQDPDQNLKYIALLALVKIVPSHPHLIAEYEEAIIASLDLPDISIRLRALDLISAMVTPNNIQSLVQQLLSHLIKPESLTTAPPSAAESLARSASGISTASVPPPTTNLAPTYRMEVSKRIIEMCSRADFENITDFEWYLSVLVDLAYIASVRIGALIRDQIIEVTLRAKSTRPYCVKLMSKLIGDDTLALSSTDEDSCSEVLWAAGWICGEYASDLSDPPQILEYLTNRHTDTLASDISSIYIQASLKVLGQWLAEKAEHWRLENLPKIIEIVSLTKSGIERLTAHHDLEVQERAASAVQLLTFIQADI
ncbi:ARM repeat-containing protein, partial [Sistotremastrum niveocremeum HHB9708]